MNQRTQDNGEYTQLTLKEHGPAFIWQNNVEFFQLIRRALNSVLICFDSFSVMIHCISKEASMRAEQFCVLTIT